MRFRSARWRIGGSGILRRLALRVFVQVFEKNFVAFFQSLENDHAFAVALPKNNVSPLVSFLRGETNVVLSIIVEDGLEWNEYRILFLSNEIRDFGGHSGAQTLVNYVESDVGLENFLTRVSPFGAERAPAGRSLAFHGRQPHSRHCSGQIQLGKRL